MKQQIIFTVVTSDKPGIVETISNIIKKKGGNWLDSRMSQLAGEFAGIVHVEIDSDNAFELEKELLTLKELDITINIRHSANQKKDHNYELHQIEFIGNDRAGIVAEVSKLFSEKNINILEFDTQITEASMAGGFLFRADAVIGVNKGTKLDELKDNLHDLADELTLDIEWSSHI